MSRKAKLETYGSRKMPLVRSASMTDAQWAATKVEFDATLRRMGKPTPWNPYCPKCGAINVRLGAVSGLCMEGNNCSGKANDAFLASFANRGR